MDMPSREGLEPIAIVGMGCRMPGDVRNPSDLWKLLMSTEQVKTEKVPPSRFNVHAYLHPNNERPGSFNVPGGCFLDEDLEMFDPAFFGTSPIEATWMDPQQKKLLEVTYEAIENSGITLECLAGAKTGCFVGCFTSDYQQMTNKEPDFRHAYATSGIDSGVLANRVSYIFDLRGPSLTVNTACSSSLYALDLACKSLASGECDGAIVGGVNLILSVDQHMNTAKLGVLSPDNQCHSFDETANGYSRAEGAGALYLKPFTAAVRDGDPIRAVIRSTASNSSGKHDQGITYPSIQGQKDVICLAHEMGGLNLENTSYIECHGTGTPVGDPVEVKAIHEVFAASRPKGFPMMIGSVKPNVGHSEAASSICTLIKTVLALETGTIPPTAGVKKLNPAIPWDDYNVKVVTEAIPFPIRSSVQRIGINAFGYGGTNAHAVLESVRSYAPGHQRVKFARHAERLSNGVTSTPHNDFPNLLVFSAHDEPTLRNNITDLAASCCDADPIDLAYTLAARRSRFSHRAFAVGRKGSLDTDIQAASGEIVAASTIPASTAFVFTGQGAQWAQMGIALFQRFPAVLQTIRSLDQHLAQLKVAPLWTIESLLNQPEKTSLVNEPEYSQPLTTAVQISIVDLLHSWGTKPTATIGHSSGEIGAAYAAGLISAESAITAAYFRGKVAASLRTHGAMLAVGLPEDAVRSYIEQEAFHGKVIIGCYNSPNSITLSGDKQAVEKLGSIFHEEKVFARNVRTGGKAYHSHHMKAAAASYASYLQDDTIVSVSHRPKVPMFSTVRTEVVGDQWETVPDHYWIENLSSPVLFEQGVKYMLKSMPEINVLIEIGPHPALVGPLRQICQASNMPGISCLPTLKRKTHDADQMLQLAGALWARSAPIDIGAVTCIEEISGDATVKRRTGSLLVDLPPYHWTYSKPCLTETRFSKEHRTIKEERHDILGRRLVGTSALEPVWRNVLRRKDLPWLIDHQLGGEVMLPAAGYLALAVEAISQINAESPQPLEIEDYTIRDVVLSTATVVPDDDIGTETMFSLRPVEGKLEISSNGRNSQWYQFVSSCYSYSTWKEAARGRIALNIKGQEPHREPHSLPALTQRGKHLDWLNKVRTLGCDLGPTFHHIGTIYTDGKTHSAKGDMGISKICGLMEGESRYVLHPTVLDSCLQPALEVMQKGRLEQFHCGLIPTHFAEVTIFPPSLDHLDNRCSIQAWSSHMGNRSLAASVQLVGYDNKLLIDITGYRALLYRAAIPQEMQGNLMRDLYTKMDWKVDIDHLDWACHAGVLSDDPVSIVVDAVLHKDAATQILCLDNSLGSSFFLGRPYVRTETVCLPQPLLDALSTVNQARMLTTLSSPHECAGYDEAYGLIIAPGINQSKPDALHHIRRGLVAGGHLLLPTSNSNVGDWENVLKSSGFSGIDCLLTPGIIATTAVKQSPETKINSSSGEKAVILIYRETPGPLLLEIQQTLTSTGWNVRCESLDSLPGLNAKRVVLLADVEGPLLSQLEQRHLDGLKSAVEGAESIVWVTCGGLLEGDRPEYGMTAGAARTIRNENASLDLVTLDFDMETTSGCQVAHLVADILTRQQLEGLGGETEYCMKNGAAYVGRLVPHRELNATFVPDSGETTTLFQLDSPAVRVEYEHGIPIYKSDQDRVAEPLGADEVEVHVAAMGLTPSDGADDVPFLNHQLAGTVKRVGPDVKGLAPGMQVIGFALDQLATFQRTSADLVYPLSGEADLTAMASLPSAFTTAFHSLEDLARLESGENVAIVDSMGVVAAAAVQLCRIAGANAILVSSPATTEILRENSHCAPQQIILDHPDGLCERLKRATGGKGVNVIVASATVDAACVEECARAVAPFGRVIIFGHAKDSHPLLHSISSVSSTHQFDLADLIRGRPQTIARALKRCVQLFENGQIQPLYPVHVKGSADINETLAGNLSAGNCVIAYDEHSTFLVSPSPTPLIFKDDSTYILVGGLGGLGRQVALWMADRGAKHLVFASRSGAGTQNSREFLQSLKNRGVDARALRVDITSREDLEQAVAKISPSYPIRGLVNAANVLHDTLFRHMTLDAWQKTTNTKVKGCLNLHEALKNQPLDFFVMTSSVAATLGSNGQSNYSAANSLLDALAVHRTSRGMPAVSLILPAIFGIGMISERPELERSIRVKGMYGIEEAEMLAAFEVAMTPQGANPRYHHIVVGVQPRRMGQAIRSASARVSWEKDRRFSWLAHAIHEQVGALDDSAGAAPAGAAGGILPAVRAAANADRALELLTAYVVARLARLLMIDTEAVQLTQKSVAGHGLDSMIGVEFRNWIFVEFKVEIPFQQLLAGSLTISELARILYEKIRE